MTLNKTAWISYGAGVNSTALIILAAQNKLAVYGETIRILFCDTQDEKDDTYDYLYTVAMPYAKKHGLTIEVCKDKDGVLERWERTGYVGSRMYRSCSDNAKTQPAKRHINAHGTESDLTLIGVHFGESHRAKGDYKNVKYPLVDMEIDQDGCVQIIKLAGLDVPPKSGCWHCPFMRVREVLDLSQHHPDRFKRIVSLEMAAKARTGKDFYQWGDKPAKYYAERACSEKSSGPLFQEIVPDEPCICQFS